MKTRKTTFLLLSTLLGIIIVAMLLGGCKDNNALKPPVEETFAISQSELALGLYETATLSVTDNKGVIVNCTWSTDNDSVSVDQQGKITANSVGTAKITAKYNEKNYDCVVTAYIPNGKGAVMLLDSENVEILALQTVAVNISILYDGKAIECPKLTVQTDDKIIDVKVNGNKISLTGLQVSDTALTVTVGCEWNGLTLAQSMQVTIKDNVIVNLSDNAITLFTYAYGDFAITKQLTVGKVIVNGQDVQAPEIEWISGDSSIATVNNGLVTSVKEGATEIKANYSYKGKTYYGICSLNIEKTQIDLTNQNLTEIVLDAVNRTGIIDLSEFSNTISFSDSITVSDEIGNVKNLAAQKLASAGMYSVSKGLKGGINKKLKIHEANFDVNIKVDIVSLEITTKEQLINLKDYVEKNYDKATYDGYFKLKNNIILNESAIQAENVWDDYNVGFTGTFDGCGYTIIGGEYGPGGLFGALASGSVVKNLAIVDACLGVDNYPEFANHGGWYPGILAGCIHGEVTDVLIELTYRKLGWYSNARNGAWGQVMGSDLTSAKLNRVVILLGTVKEGKDPTYQSTFALNGGSVGNEVTLQDVYFETYNKQYQDNVIPEGNCIGAVTGITSNENMDWMIGKGNFGSNWYLFGKMPQFVSYCSPVSIQDVDYSLFTSLSGAERVANTAVVAIDLAQYGFTDSAIIKISGSEIPEKINVTQGLITIPSTVIARLGCGKHSLQIMKNANGNSLFVDINIFTKILSNADDVKNLLTYADKKNVWTADEITASPQGMTGISYTGTFTLANNIELKETQITNLLPGYSDYCGFNGTFDGRGYMIIGGHYYLGGLFGNVGKNAVIKNFAIVNGCLDRGSYGTGGCWSSYGMQPTVLGLHHYGTMSDVLIEITKSENVEADKGNTFGGVCGSVFRTVRAGSVTNCIVYMPTDALTTGNGVGAFCEMVDGGNFPSLAGYLYDENGNCIKNSVDDKGGYQSFVTGLLTFATKKDASIETAMLTAGTINSTCFWKGAGEAGQDTYSFKLGTTLTKVKDTLADGYDDCNSNKNISLDIFNSTIWDLSGDVARFKSYNK